MGRLPVVSELFDFSIELFGPRDERSISIVRQAKVTWDKQHSEGLSEQFIAHALIPADGKRDSGGIPESAWV
jgi:hypothetical protein